MATVYLSLGTNIGNKEKQMNEAIERIETQIGDVVSRSTFYVTEPWGFESSERFLNAAVKYVLSVPRGTSQSAFSRHILDICKSVERTMGRTGLPEYTPDGRRVYHSRIIDIDILLIGDWHVNETDLKIPHPLMWERDFVMVPLSEILQE